MNGQHEFRYEVRTTAIEPISMAPYETLEQGMWCRVCGQRMNEAAPACPGRKPDEPKG
jgi:hypothetical protein